MGVQERKARDKQELRQEILDAARELFIREGFENVSMRKIAEKIEYSATTIYLYFQDKADLLDCVCEETLQKLENRLSVISTTTPDPLERMMTGLRAYVDFGLEYPNDYKVAFCMDLKAFADPDRCVGCHSMGQQNLNYMRRDVSECMRLGLFAPGDVEATSQALWAAIHGVTSLLILHPLFPWVQKDSLIDTLIGTVMGGLQHRLNGVTRPG